MAKKFGNRQNFSYNQNKELKAQPLDSIEEELQKELVSADVLDEVPEEKEVVEEEVLEEENSVHETKEESQVNVQKTTETKEVNEEFVQPKRGSKVMAVRLFLDNYKEALDPKKAINPEEGVKWSMSLHKVFLDALNKKEYNEFKEEWTEIINYFRENKDNPYFNENAIFRFTPYWYGSEKLFRRLAMLIIYSTTPESRKVIIEKTDFNTYLEGLTEEQKQKLITFYSK